MIIEKRIEKIEIRLSDYCKGCEYKDIEYEEYSLLRKGVGVSGAVRTGMPVITCTGG